MCTKKIIKIITPTQKELALELTYFKHQLNKEIQQDNFNTVTDY